jgi:protoporphyrinogen/coproporphyrinogen III oxidase
LSGPPRRIAIIGAGMAGLSAAFRLTAAGYTVVVLERAPAAGGRTKSVENNGFTIDVGAGILPATYVDVARLIRDAGLEHLKEPIDGFVGTPRDGKLHLLDMRHPAMSLLKSKLLSWPSKIRLARLLLKLQKASDVLGFDTTAGAAPFDTESIADYCRRVLNDELREYFLEPLTRTLYLHNADEGSIVELLWSLKNVSSNSSFALRGGMDSVARALASRFDVRYGIEVHDVRRVEDGCSVTFSQHGNTETTEMFDACVCAVDARDMSQLLSSEFSQEQRAFLANIKYSTSVNLHYQLSSPLDNPALIIQVPRSIDPCLAAIVQDNLKGSGRAPPGKGLVSVFLTTDWGQSMWSRPDPEILADVAPRLEAVLPGFGGLIEAVHIERWRRAATIGRVGYYKELSLFEATLDTGGAIQLASDIFAPSSVNVAVKQGQRAAERIMGRFAALALTPSSSAISNRSRG